MSTTGRPSEPPSATVVAVEVDRQRAVTVEFDDGLVAEFGLVDLRRACPCAGCQGRREQGRSAYEGESISILDAELHGNWALSLRWSDGHDTGMFAWTYLRALAEPDDRVGVANDPTPAAETNRATTAASSPTSRPTTPTEEA